MLALEGVEHAADLVMTGDSKALAAAVRRYRDAGATEITLTHTDLGGDTARRRTWAAAGRLTV